MLNMAEAGISPSPDEVARERERLEPELEAGEALLAEASGVRLGWQWRTIAIWWLPGALFVALAWIQFRSLIVTLALALFCIGLFAFYSFDREVRPRRSGRRYLLSDRRVLVEGDGSWRAIPLSDIASTRMDTGLMDLAVARLSGAATILLELRTPGPRGEPRRTRIGPMRAPEIFRERLEAARGGS